MAAGFSEEDLTRYLQLSLDLFQDLQASLQPRFHLEIGLVRLVQAGRLLPIEQALAGLTVRAGAAPAARARAAASPPPLRAPASRAHRSLALRTGPREESGTASAASRNRRAPMRWRRNRSARTANRSRPATGGSGCTPRSWNSACRSPPMPSRMPASSKPTANCRFTASKADSLALRPEDLNKAIQQISGRPMRIKVTVGDAGAPAAPLIAPKPAANEDDATNRALANPEVQRFREVFGGEVRKVRNLKE